VNSIVRQTEKTTVNYYHFLLSLIVSWYCFLNGVWVLNVEKVIKLSFIGLH